MDAFFDGDDDELLFLAQRESKSYCLKRLLAACKELQAVAEEFVGLEAETRWTGDDVVPSDFDAIIEVIAAAYRYETNARQHELFNPNIKSYNSMQALWMTWFEAFVEKLVDNIHMSKLVLSLANQSCTLVKYKGKLKYESEIRKISDEIIDDLVRFDFVPSEIKTPAYAKLAAKKADKPKARNQNSCDCTKSGKSPCNIIPCLTLAKRSAAKGIYLE